MKTSILFGLIILGLIVGCGQKGVGAGNPASLDELNRALAVVVMQGGVFPPATNDLAALLGGKSMPVPPPGKKLVIDPGKRQYLFVDQ
jgi:hypothetical protein